MQLLRGRGVWQVYQHFYMWFIKWPVPVAVFSDAILHSEALSQRNWELLREATPVFLTNLVLETMQNLETSNSTSGNASNHYCTNALQELLCTIHTLLNMSFRSPLGLTHEATASQKKMKFSTTPCGLWPIIVQMPRKAESFSSLSRIFRREVHLGANHAD